MKIHIKQAKKENEKKHNIKLHLPTSLLNSRLIVNIFYKKIAEKNPDFTKEKLRNLQKTLYKSIKDYKKTHGKLVLVEVESNDGDYVLITL